MQLRETFDEDARLYDRVRPGYPDALFDDLERLAGLGPGSRVLELGCGTGQATAGLALRGYEVVAVELGARMAEVARRKLPGVEVVTAAFEAWPLPREPFDAVVSATAFHWIDPAVRISKSLDALRPGGALAIVSTHHVAGGDQRFFDAAQRCYERWDPDNTPPGLRLGPAPAVTTEAEELGAHFDELATSRYERELTYTSAEYRELLLSYSGHQAMSPDARRGLLDCVTGLIDKHHGGRISKRYMNELVVARKRWTSGSDA